VKNGLTGAALIVAWIVGTAISLFEIALMYAVYRRHGLLLGAVVWVQLQLQIFLYLFGLVLVVMVLFAVVKWTGARIFRRKASTRT